MRTSRLIRAGAVLIVAVAILGTARWHVAGSAPNWRVEFAEAALKIPFEDERPPMLETGLPRDIVIPDSIAHLRVAVARTKDTSRAGRIVFRISSDKGYAPLGIAPGLNYLWSDMVNGKTRLLVIPRDPKANTHWLNVRSHTHNPGMNAGGLYLMENTARGQPPVRHVPGGKVVALQPCACTSENCSYSWCNGCDTSAALRVEAPVVEIKHYFARNDVPWPERP